jgi:hypothetical protein
MAAPSLVLREVKSNTRLRWGIWTIVGVVWLYGVLVLQDEVGVARQAYATLLKNQIRLQALLHETEWPRRQEEARKRLNQMEKRLWREANPGLAQAVIQDWLGQQMLAANMSIPTLNVAIYQDPTESGKQSHSLGLWKVTARITGKLTAEKMAALLSQIESEPRQLIIEGLKVKGVDDALNIEILLAAYFLPSESDKAAKRLASGNRLPVTVTGGHAP